MVGTHRRGRTASSSLLHVPGVSDLGEEPSELQADLVRAFAAGRCSGNP